MSHLLEVKDLKNSLATRAGLVRATAPLYLDGANCRGLWAEPLR
jgi:hypothetical protein